ncbi:MAG TPA: threonine--tRNA ligase [Acidimicrobiia bacterium]|nr:threonine--tRNA ligase [Acidimicrobiia bacterium]
MADVTLTLPDGSTKDVPKGTTPAQVAASIGPRLARDVLAAIVDDEWVDLDRPLDHDARLRLVTPATPEGREVLRHSTAHVLAQAVTDLFPGAQYAIGPAIDDGLYYDFLLPDGGRFTDDDLERISARMREIVAEDQPFQREEVGRDEGRTLFADQPFKQEIIDRVDDSEVGGGAVISVYRNPRPDGAFVDLCRGPHVPSTGRLGAFRLMRVAGAYWRGDEHQPALQRIYGTAWESEAALAEHLHRLEEAERRDHRRLGAELDLFSFPEEIGSGLPVFHPKGGIVRVVMEDDSRRRHQAAGYSFVNTPHITKAQLFEESGHLQTFGDSMFPPMLVDEGSGTGTAYYVKPMNCPFHILIYRSHPRSYRDLPLRLFEFGTVYRYERSGVVHGLTRVRGLTMDDAHIFATREQMADEIRSIITFVGDVLRDYGLSDFFLELSTRPEGKSFGSDADWDEATAVLREVGEGMGLEFVLDEGGGAFYGPKISVQARDAIGRTWQSSTIQLDFQLPERFDLHYVGADNERRRPVMIHRALFGSIERFFAIVLEHYAGALPAWLAPVQGTVLPVADRHDEYAARVVGRITAAGYRTELVGAHLDTLRARVRDAKLQKVPYVLVVGDQDVEGGTVGVNARGTDRPERDVTVDAFEARLAADVAARR